MSLTTFFSKIYLACFRCFKYSRRLLFSFCFILTTRLKASVIDVNGNFKRSGSCITILTDFNRSMVYFRFIIYVCLNPVLELFVAEIPYNYLLLAEVLLGIYASLDIVGDIYLIGHVQTDLIGLLFVGFHL